MNRKRSMQNLVKTSTSTTHQGTNTTGRFLERWVGIDPDKTQSAENDRESREQRSRTPRAPKTEQTDQEDKIDVVDALGVVAEMMEGQIGWEQKMFDGKEDIT